MAKCEYCNGLGIYVYASKDRYGNELPGNCPKCGGAGELSCCDGPTGHADELPTDPNEPSRST